METNTVARAPADIIAIVDQKAMRLSGLLRELDNHPIRIDGDLRDRVNEVLEALSCRITATRQLINQPAVEPITPRQ